MKIPTAETVNVNGLTVILSVLFTAVTRNFRLALEALYSNTSDEKSTALDPNYRQLKRIMFAAFGEVEFANLVLIAVECLQVTHFTVGEIEFKNI